MLRRPPILIRSLYRQPRHRLPPHIHLIRSFQLSSARIPTPRANSRIPPYLSLLGTAASILLTFHILTTYFYSLTLTWGPSMLPTISADGTTWVLISKWYRRGRGVQVGDLVSFTHPVSPHVSALKRVVGLEGDFVGRDTPVDALGGEAEVRRNDEGEGEESGRVEVGGDEGWDRQVMIQVPRGHVYVVGDNLHHSRDSRMFGPLPLALIKGKVTYMLAKDDRFWPRKVPNGLVNVTDS